MATDFFEEHLRRLDADFEAEQALKLMHFSEAEAILAPTDPIPNLGKESLSGVLDYVPLLNMEVDGHKVGWVRAINRNKPKIWGDFLQCEDDSGDKRDEAHGCWAKKIVKAAKAAQVGHGYGFDCTDALREGFDFQKSYPSEYVMDVIDDLYKRVFKDQEWVGNWSGQHLAPLTIFGILGLPSGSFYVWNYFDALVDRGSLRRSEDGIYSPADW